jgi:ribonuclease-3
MVIRRCWADTVTTYDENIHDPKTRLQELCQQNHKKLPQYELVSVTGLDHCPEFTVSATINEHVVTTSGPSKKKAEILAASLLLNKLKTIEHK